MRTFQTLPIGTQEPLPEWNDVDVRSNPSLPRWVIDRFSDPDDVVFDPFTGFGTTVAAAVESGRTAYGIELERRRVEYVRERVAAIDATGDDEPIGSAHVVVGDAMRGAEPFAAAGIDVPPVDLVCTSPPYLIEGMETNPFENYRGESSYAGYLADTTALFEAVGDLLDSDATVVVEAANLRFGPTVTTLAWDLAEAIDSAIGYRFRTEIVVGFEPEGSDRSGPGRDCNTAVGTETDRDGNTETDRDTSTDDDSEFGGGYYGYGYDHCYCLVFDRVESTDG